MVLEGQLLQDVMDVVRDRPHGHGKLVGYLLVGGALTGPLQDLDLPGRELGLRLPQVGPTVGLAHEGLKDALRHRGGDDGLSPQGALATQGAFSPPAPTFHGAPVGGTVGTNAAGAATWK